MTKRIINDIILELKKRLKDKGSYARLEYTNYRPIKIDKKNFSEIKSVETKNKIYFIDGGNIEILGSVNFSLQLIRLCCVAYRNNQRIKLKREEFFLLVTSKQKEDRIIYETNPFPLGSFSIQNISFDSSDRTLSKGNHMVKISSIGNAVRRLSELKLAKHIVENANSGEIVVLDGSLEPSFINENSYLDELYAAAIKKNVVVTALSKTSRIFTENGNSLIPILNEISPNSSWYYYPVAEIKGSPVDLYIVKLHKSSKYIFKFEVFNKLNYNINIVLTLLKNNSKDPIFFGYPYGLIDADRFARVSNKEKKYLRTIFLMRFGPEIEQYLNTINAHDILDSMSY